MAIIRASCPRCGDVELASPDMTVRVHNPDGSGSYAFECRRCGEVVVKSAETRTIDLLMASGVRQSLDPPPAEVSERPNIPDPITDDEMIEFHEALQGDDWFEELANPGA